MYIVGKIAIAATYYGEQFQGEIDLLTNLPKNIQQAIAQLNA